MRTWYGRPTLPPILSVMGSPTETGVYILNLTHRLAWAAKQMSPERANEAARQAGNALVDKGVLGVNPQSMMELVSALENDAGAWDSIAMTVVPSMGLEKLPPQLANEAANARIEDLGMALM